MEDLEKNNQLLLKYQQGKCTPEEKKLVEYLYNFAESTQDQEKEATGTERIKAEIWARLPEASKIQKPARINKLKWISAAAAMAAITLSIWIYTSRNAATDPNHPKSHYTTDIAPGKNTATLTLANGKTIALSDSKTGVVISASQLSYNDGSSLPVETDRSLGEEADKQAQILSATTPRGGTYQVRLSDGTKVWLNAASSIKFPASFSAKERMVELTGEAYLEVAKDKTRPFIVRSGSQQVEVLGTHFNINNYNPKAVRTSLLEGKVRVSSADGKQVVLSPGQQSLYDETGLELENRDAAYATAWKDGYFLFNNEDLGSIMQTLSRWYRVEVAYTDPTLQTERFFGKISRYEHISKILRMLERTDVVQFSVEDGKVTGSRKQ